MFVIAPSTQHIDYPAWISAFSALVGVPLSLIAFIKLIRRDKEKQAQIDKLASMAAILDNQTSEMRKHNELVAMQVEILRESSQKGGADKEAMEKLQEIEAQKLRLSVQPRLWLNGAGYTGWNGELQIDLNNKGEVAHLDEFNLLSGPIELHSLSLPYDLEKGGRRLIFARGKPQQMHQTQYQIEVLYHNALDQPYRAVIEGKGANVKILSDGPVEANAGGGKAEAQTA